MSSIFTISGRVKHTITIDQGVWIFDDRKVDLDTYFSQEPLKHDEMEEKKLAKAWDLHRSQGSNARSNGNDIKMSKKDLTEKSFGIPFSPFLKNAGPLSDATKVIFKRSTGEDFECPMKEAEEAILGFSNKGKSLKENGPVHFYYGNGANSDTPVTHITGIIVL